jgi:hypothetical protein
LGFSRKLKISVAWMNANGTAGSFFDLKQREAFHPLQTHKNGEP